MLFCLARFSTCWFSGDKKVRFTLGSFSLPIDIDVEGAKASTLVDATIKSSVIEVAIFGSSASSTKIS